MELAIQKKEEKHSWLKKLLMVFAFFFCFFGLTSCASTKQEGKYTQSFTATYNAGADTTLVSLTTDLENLSIFNITNLFYTFDLYNGDTLLRTTDELAFDVQLSHGETKTFYNDFAFDGNITKVQVNHARAEWANIWDSYEGWWIGTIIGVVVLTIALIVMFFVSDGDILDMLEDNSWLLYMLIPVGISLGVTGITSWVSLNWVPICIVAGGIVAVAILLGLIALIGFLIEEFSFSIDIEGKYIALVITGLLLIGGFVCGCIFWKWWACLVILVGSTGLVIGIYFLARGIQKLALEMEKKKAKSKKQSKKLEENDYDEQDEVQEIDPVTGEAKPVKTPKTYKAKIKFDDIAGLEEAKEAFKEKVILPFEHPEIYEKFGKKAGGGILLYGLPGTGKTMFAEATSNELNATFIPVKCSDIKSKWYGESEQKVKAIFAKAKKSKKAIIFFDEFEAIGSKRTDDGNNGNNDLVPEILAEMQGVGSSRFDSTIMIIAATNKPWAIDSAFMRPGRFDEKIYVPLPDMVARKKLFEIQLSKLPVADDLDYDYLAKITEGFNGADIKEVCEKLKMSAIKDSLDKGEDQTIGMDDVAKIEKTIKSSVSQEDIAQLKAFEEGLK